MNNLLATITIYRAEGKPPFWKRLLKRGPHKYNSIVYRDTFDPTESVRRGFSIGILPSTSTPFILTGYSFVPNIASRNISDE